MTLPPRNLPPSPPRLPPAYPPAAPPTIAQVRAPLPLVATPKKMVHARRVSSAPNTPPPAAPSTPPHKRPRLHILRPSTLCLPPRHTRLLDLQPRHAHVQGQPHISPSAQPLRCLRRLPNPLRIPRDLPLVQIALGRNPQHFLQRLIALQPRNNAWRCWINAALSRPPAFNR